MKKFINAVDFMVAESLDGFVGAHESLLAFGAGRKFVRRRDLVQGNMAGLSVTLAMLSDAERDLWDAPVATPAMCRGS
jgi:dihydroxyacetone kinase